MKKSIKVEAKVVPGFNKVMFKVIGQSHLGINFGVANSRDERKFTATNGITLASNRHPARDTDDANVIWVRGSKSKSDNTVVVCKESEWPKIQEAIRQYNQFNFPERRYCAPAPAYRATAAKKADSCTIIVG